MNGCGPSVCPLTTAQRGLWFSQKITPGALLNIAEAVEICGPVEPDVFRQALHDLVAEAEGLRLRVVEHDAQPRQSVRSVYEGDFPYIDMSGEADPDAAIKAWMKHEASRQVDLANDPLWVSALFKAADDRYFWYHRAHHIACDGYGGGLVARRLAELYTARVENREPGATPFCTVEATVEAETSYRTSRRFQRDRDYWQQQLAQLPEAVTLSRNHRRHGLSSNLLRSTGHFSPGIALQLAELGKVAGISLPQVLISLIAAYYQRATGVSDLVFGMPVSGRLNAALRGAITVCANMLPIRLSFMPDMTPLDLFEQVSRIVMQALRHQQYRYEDLRRDLGLVGQDQNIAWLGINIEPFDYRLNFNSATTTLHNVSNSSTEDLMVFVYGCEIEAGLRFDLDANPALYSRAELCEHRTRLARLVEQVLANPSRPLRRLDLIGEEERHRLVFGWNNTAGTLPDASLPELVARWANETPDAPAVAFEKTTLSYAELQERIVRQTHQLLANGVRTGDIVAVALPRSEQLLIALLAIMRTGAAYLPLDLESPMERTALVLDDALPVALIAHSEIHDRFARNGLKLLRPEDPNSAVAGPMQAPDLSTPDGVAYVLYTSGSTGRPKGVEITHRNLNNFLEGMKQQLMPASNDRFLAVTTVIFDIAGLELYLPLTVGAQVVVAGVEAVRNPPVLARLIQSSRATHMQATPSLWRILLASSDANLSGLHVLVGGEALSADLAARLKQKAARVTQFYGPTETTIWSTAFELDEISSAPPPIGRPILNTQVYVLDEDRQPVMAGAIGELYIGGSGVAKGYLYRPELTGERFLRNPFVNDSSRMYRTGDLVRWNHDGLLEFVGRIDDQIKINGHRVELGEIESLLLEHPAVNEAVAAAHRESGGAMSITSYVVAKSGTAIDTDTLRTFLAGRLPRYMMPGSFMVIDQLPLTPNGKLDRKALPRPERVSRNVHAEPVTATQKRLVALWQQVLKVKRIGIHDNFYELGGSSLTAAELAAHFPAWFDVELPLGSLFDAPTVAGLAPIIEQLSSEQSDPLNVIFPLRKVEESGQPPLFCIHPMIGLSIGFSGLARHLDPMIPVYGLQSRGLQGSVNLPDSMEDMAADYVAQIRRIQPEGPYRLLGRSMGGLIAHCMTGQMQASGLLVELLAMIDSSLFTSDNFARRHTEVEEVRAALGFLDIELDADNTPQTLKALGEFLLRSENMPLVPVARSAMSLARQMEKSNPAFIEHLSAVMLNNLRLARQYTPRKVNLDLLYFHATEITGDVNGIVDRGPSAWRPFIGGEIEVHELACHHEAVLEPFGAAQIGRILTQRLSEPAGRWVSEMHPAVQRQARASTAGGL